MPLQYTGILEEHRATRERAALFDVSHMGEIDIQGKDALSFLQYVLTRDLANLRPGQMKLSLILNELGGIKDDITVYVRGGDNYRLVTNASTKKKIIDWLLKVKAEKGYGNLKITDVSDETGKIDLQGPLSPEILRVLGSDDYRNLPYYHFMETYLGPFLTLVSRSGYTGEDGFEIYVPAQHTRDLWEMIIKAGKPYGLLPAGLGARDTLRLEAGMMLYGNELNESVNPFEVVYAWAVDMEKDFIGREALLKVINRGIDRKLVGFVLEGKGIARHGYPVLKDGMSVGEVTSGTYAPTVGGAIGMAFVPPRLAEEGGRLEINIRGNFVSARIVKMPFYKRKK